MARGPVISARALGLALLFSLLCLIEASALPAVKRRVHKTTKKGRKHIHLPLEPRGKARIMARSVAPVKFVGFNLGDGNSLTVEELGSYAVSINVTRLKMFHTVTSDIATLSKVKVMAGLQNWELYGLASRTNGPANAMKYVQEKIRPYPQIHCVAVGNEPFASWYNKAYDALIAPAVTNLHKALKKSRISRKVNLVVPLDFASMYRANFTALITPVLKILKSTKSPFVINAYPDYACKKDPIPISYCLGNSSAVSAPGKPASMLDAMVQEAQRVVTKLGYGVLEVQVGETGWPTGDGHPLSTVKNQEAYINGVLKYVRGGGASVYIFQLQDGSSDSLGVLRKPSGDPKFPMPKFF